MPLRSVLLLTYHFPPSGAVAVYRMLGLVRHLPKFGWQPVVVAPPGVPWEPQDASLLGQVPTETPIARVPFASGFVGKIARWVAPEAHWLYRARSACRRMIREHRPEAVITSSPPGCVHRLGLWVQQQFGLPWLACFRDPWIVNASIERWTLHRRYERRIEARVMQRATRLIANTPLNERGWVDAYPEQAHKIVTIINGFDPERFAPSPEPRPRGLPLTILHAGELYHGRDPRPFLDALEGERPPLRVEFLGRQTAGGFDLPAEIGRRGLADCVTQIGQIPYKEALARMMRTDILLLVHTPGQALGVPAKLYEYLGTGRPILALAEPAGDIAWVLRESKVLHRIAAPADVPAIKQALLELTRAVQAGEPVVPDPAALAQFTRERMAQRFAECLDEAAPGAREQNALAP
jgi:glycosyltransferase involved in cell wall biosynthesis